MSKPLNIVFLSGEAQPLKLDHNDRRFFAVQSRRCIWCGHSEHEPAGCEACHHPSAKEDTSNTSPSIRSTHD